VVCKEEFLPKVDFDSPILSFAESLGGSFLGMTKAVEDPPSEVEALILRKD
jgi:hypothetical protein